MVYGIWNGMEGQSCALRSLGAAMPIYNAHQRIFEGLEGGGEIPVTFLWNHYMILVFIDTNWKP